MLIEELKKDRELILRAKDSFFKFHNKNICTRCKYSDCEYYEECVKEWLSSILDK